MSNKLLNVVAACGVMAVLAIGFNARYPLSSLIGGIIKSAPYICSVVVAAQAGREWLARSLACGLFTFLVIDVYVSYYAIRQPTSSTDPVAALLITVASVIIIPAVTVLTYQASLLIHRLRRKSSVR